MKEEDQICKNCKHLGWMPPLNTHVCKLTQETYHTVEKTKGMAGYSTGETTFLENTCDKFEIKELTPIKINIPLSIKERFEVVVEEYLTAFCNKQGFDRSDGWWVADRIGEVFGIADMMFDFREIKFDVDSNQPAKQIIDWHWKMVENALDKPFPDPFPNYENWCKMKPNTEEE